MDKIHGYFKQRNATAHTKLTLTILAEIEGTVNNMQTLATLISTSESMQLIFDGATVR